jgi:OOP family OmpA-OmpF porin
MQYIRLLLEENPTLCLRVDGHTDSIGEADYNRELSTQRAQAIHDFLTGSGITKNRLQSEGFGEERPVADNRTSSGRAQNRRVELHKISCPQ